MSGHNRIQFYTHTLEEKQEEARVQLLEPGRRESRRANLSIKDHIENISIFAGFVSQQLNSASVAQKQSDTIPK